MERQDIEDEVRLWNRLQLEIRALEGDNVVSETDDSIESNLSAPGLGVLSIGLLAHWFY